MSQRPDLVACLKILGITPTLETFDERKLLQKLVYLMKMFGVDFGFHYNWYIHGPYSPDLTRELYQIVENNPAPVREPTKSAIEGINALKSFLGEDIHSSDSAELIASIIFLKENTKGSGASEDEIVQAIKRVKPYFSYKQIRDSWRRAIELERAAKHFRCA
jgi:uncharacterized protein YwgA